MPRFAVPPCHNNETHIDYLDLDEVPNLARFQAKIGTNLFCFDVRELIQDRLTIGWWRCPVTQKEWHPKTKERLLQRVALYLALV